MAEKSEYLPGEYARCNGTRLGGKWHDPCKTCLRRVAPWTSNRNIPCIFPSLNFDGSCDYFIPTDKEPR